jgi:hypothetical protein
MKILIISQHLFPMQTPRAHRTTELVKELGRQGHEVTLYAVIGTYDYNAFENKYNVRVRNIPLKWMVHPYSSDNDGKRTFIDKVLGRLLRKLEFPNLEFRFRIPKVLKKEYNYDALISIADPHQIHWGIAQYRKNNLANFPKVWIADCGDPFMLNGATNRTSSYFEKMERLFCEQCDFITVPVEEAKMGYYHEYRNKIQVIPQGFQFELIETKIPTENSIPTFAYAGTFYRDIRNPEKLMNYLSTIEMDYRFVVYTAHTSLIDNYKRQLGEKLEIRKPIPREDLIKELRKMDFLINIENSNSPAQVPSKLIDYAITGRPTISINPSQFDLAVLDKFMSGDYSNQFIVNDLEKYKIENVAGQFIQLIKSKQ